MDIIYDIFKIFENILKSFSNDFTVSEIVTWIALLISSFFGLLVYIKKELQEESKNIIVNHLSSQETIKEYFIELSKKSSKKTSLYKENLKQALLFLDTFFEKIKFFSFKTLKKHLYIAYLYTILFFIISWFFGGTGKIANNVYLPDIENVQIRINIFLSLLATLSSAVLLRGYGIDEKIYNSFFKKMGEVVELIFMGSIFLVLRTSKYIIKKFILLSKVSWKELKEEFKYKSIYSEDNSFHYADNVIMSLIATSFIVGMIFFLLLNNVYSCVPDYKVGVFVVSIIIIFFVYSLFTLMIMTTLGSLMEKFLAFLVFLSMLGLILYMTGMSGIIGFILFFILLPIINAIFDYVSLYFSRLFAENIYQTTSKMKIFIDLVLDILVAIVLFILFAWILYLTIDFANAYFIKDAFYQIPIDMYWKKISKNPFDKEVLWITLMFVSTLIPTFLHVVLGIYSILENLIIKPHINILVQQIEKMTPTKEIREKEKVAKELAKYNLSNVIKLYLILGALLVTFIIFLILLLGIKKGFYNI